MRPLADQIASAISAAEAHANSTGLAFAQRTLEAADELRLWLHYLRTHTRFVCAEELLSGAYAAIIESAGYISLGLGRAAIMAIRAQIDLTLSFTFFGEHPREWERVQDVGEGFRLRSDLYKYHTEVDKQFKQRIGLLDQMSKPTVEGIYRILSAHIHGQSAFTIPKIGDLEELVMPNAFIESLIEAQAQSAQAVSNYLTALYADDWPSIPSTVTKRIQNTLTDAQRQVFFP